MLLFRLVRCVECCLLDIVLNNFLKETVAVAMALLDLDNIAPHLERNSIVSIPQYKIKDGRYAVSYIFLSSDVIRR